MTLANNSPVVIAVHRLHEYTIGFCPFQSGYEFFTSRLAQSRHRLWPQVRMSASSSVSPQRAQLKDDIVLLVMGMAMAMS